MTRVGTKIGGTLLDFNATWVPAYRAIARRVAGGDEALARRLLQTGGQDDATGTVEPGSVLAAGGVDEIAATWAEVAPDHGHDDLVAVLDAEFRRAAERSAVIVDELPNVLAALAGRGLRLDIATNDSVAGVEATLARFDVLRYFDSICGYDSGYGSKPAPGMVEEFCEATGLRPTDVMVVGDNRHDPEMGRNAGVGWVIGVLTGTSGREHLAPLADTVIDSIRDLPAVIDGIAWAEDDRAQSVEKFRGSPMSLIATRMDRFQPTASSVATQRARELAAEGRDIIRLAQGEPDFPTPENVKQAAIRAMERDETRYTPTGGTVALKEAIAEKFRRDNGLDYAPEQIIAGTGGKQVIFSAILATVEPGEEVIIPAPYFVAYPDVVKFARGVPVIVECAEAHGFKLQPDELVDAITEKTKWLILNSPNNPCGSAYSKDELAALATVLLENPHVHVLTDDIYEHILFDGRPFHTIAAVEPGLYDRTLTVNGVSKAYSMTGWRLGFAGGPAALIGNMTKLQNQNTGNPCSITQAAAIEALTGPQAIVGERTAEFQQRRDVVVGLLNETAGLSCRTPEGAFYVYPNCSTLIGRRTPSGRVIETDQDVVVYLMEEGGVAGVHGAAFGLSPYFRLSTAASMEELKEACVRVQAACQALS